MPSCRARRRGRRARMMRNCLTRGEARLARVTRIVLPSVAVLSTVLRTLTLLVLLATTAGAPSRDRAGGRARIALERVAVTVMDFEPPDNAGHLAQGESCVTGGPAAYLATLPLDAMLAALLAEGVPAYVSNTAGTYLCNLTMYGTLDWLAARNHPARAGFVHLPLSPPMVAASGLDQPSMGVGLMVRGVEIALGVVARTTFPGKEVRP